MPTQERNYGLTKTDRIQQPHPQVFHNPRAGYENRDVQRWANTMMKQDDATVVGPSAYLLLALLSSFVPIIHHLGLREALDNTRYPWGLHPIEILWLRDLGQNSAWIAAALALCFILSFRVARLRTIKAWRITVTLTLLFWVIYSVAASLTMVIQLNLGNSI